MPAINATSGDPGANSYATASECNAYCDARLNADAWNTQNDDDVRARALIEATRELNVVSYVGSRATVTQGLAWPRLFALNPDAQSIQALGDIALLYFGSTEIPKRVKDATCELALQFLNAGSTDVASIDPAIAVLREKVDVLETEYAQPFMRAQGLARFPRVLNLIAPLLDSAALGTAVVRT